MRLDQQHAVLEFLELTYRRMGDDDDEGSHGPVDLCQVSLQPVVLHKSHIGSAETGPAL